MEKLELKHLAPYLPFKLQFKDTYALDSSVYILTPNNISHWENGNVKTFLPILRPLSDLTKEIEVNREKFVPNKKMSWLFDKYFDYSKFILEGKLTYSKMLMLLEWHFDVYGLIEKGLAVDINTLNK